MKHSFKRLALGVVGVAAMAVHAFAQTPTPKRTPTPAPAVAATIPSAPANPGAGATSGAGGAGGDEAPKVKVERGAGGKKVYRITEEIRIEGKIQKPEAFFFYQKSNINYDWQELKQDVIPKILDSVSRAPF